MERYIENGLIYWDNKVEFYMKELKDDITI